MSRSRLRLLLLLLVVWAGQAAAAAPATFGYQGRLASAGGAPITSTLAITFRLYDAPSGGSALWSEVQPAVAVDGGNLGVELGTVVPLPANLWGRQLYLGVQIAGDTEMAPRPALTAAPYAFRAGATMARTRLVSAEGTPIANGTALLATVAAIGDATAQDPVVVEIDAGRFDLGTATLVVPPHVTLAGRAQQSSVITSAPSGGTQEVSVRLSSHSAARDITVRNTGIGATDDASAVAIAAYDPAAFQVPVVDVRIERVTGESIAAAGAPGQRAGINVCASDSELRDVTGRAIGGMFGMGLRADCPGATGTTIDGATLEARDSSSGLRGTYLAGSGLWRNITVTLETHPGLLNVFGIRVLAGTGGASGQLVDPRIVVRGSNLAATTQTAFIEGIRADYGIVPRIEGAAIRLEDVKAVFVSGIHTIADVTITDDMRVVDADIAIRAVQDAAAGAGGIQGLRLRGIAPQIAHSRIDVRCLAPGYNACQGILQQPPPGPGGGTSATMQAGSLRVEQSHVLARHDDPFDASASTQGLVVTGPAHVRESTIHVVRSSDLETHHAIRLDGGAASVRVHGSTLHAETPSSPANSCSVGGSGSAELFGNVVVGLFNCAASITFNCAGNTRAGAGFLAAGCT